MSDSVAEAQRSFNYLCDVCRAAPGVEFYDHSWCCAACGDELLQQLYREAYTRRSKP